MSAITVSNVSKQFRYIAIPKHTTLKDSIVHGLLQARGKQRIVEALSDISFVVEPGQMLGVIGRNGSGKTTLLRLLGGVFPPNSGSVKIEGSLSPLLALGAGFHPDLTGRENARVEMLVLGFTPKQVAERIDAIIDFSEIGDFIDAPVRTYSVGMTMRLAFATAMNVDPDVLLLDEVLAVGDHAFAVKCLTRIHDFKRSGKTIVIVTHNPNVVKEQCDVALWLDHGKMRAFGDPHKVSEEYDRNE